MFERRTLLGLAFVLSLGAAGSADANDDRNALGGAAATRLARSRAAESLVVPAMDELLVQRLSWFLRIGRSLGLRVLPEPPIRPDGINDGPDPIGNSGGGSESREDDDGNSDDGPTSDSDGGMASK